MAFESLESLGKKLARLGQDTKSSVQKLGENYQLNSRISDEKKALEKAFAEIGEAVFNADPDNAPEGLEEVFELVKPTNLVINIEIKTGVVFYPIEEKLLALTKEFGMEDRVFYSSFNHYTVKKIHELDPSTVVGFLYGDGPIDMPAYGEKHGVNALHPALYNLQYPGFVEECKKKGLKLHVWTVNEEKYVKMCMDAQVDSVITNYPDMALRVLGR